jgi:excisionase family DNA binding protein
MSASAMLTVAEVSTRLTVTTDTVCVWIAGGSLPAVDVSRGRGSKPRWRIALDDLEMFLAARRSRPAPVPRRRKPSLPAGFVRHFR